MNLAFHRSLNGRLKVLLYSWAWVSKQPNKGGVKGCRKGKSTNLEKPCTHPVRTLMTKLHITYPIPKKGLRNCKPSMYGRLDFHRFLCMWFLYSSFQLSYLAFFKSSWSLYRTLFKIFDKQLFRKRLKDINGLSIFISISLWLYHITSGFL